MNNSSVPTVDTSTYNLRDKCKTCVDTEKLIWKKNYMDLLVPGILLAVTLIWKDFIWTAANNVVKFIGLTETTSIWSTLFTGVILTSVAIYIINVKYSIDSEVNALKQETQK
jgi:hypothetical protein